MAPPVTAPGYVRTMPVRPLLLMCATLSLLAGCAPLPVPPLPPDGDYDCRHFATRGQAQRAFEAAGGPRRDPHRLDTDGRARDSLWR